MATKHFIQAQRYIKDYGWMPCEPHQAKMWAAYIGARLIGRYPQKFRAVEVLELQLKRNLGLARAYKLGVKMEQSKVSTSAYAISLTSEQYEQAQQARSAGTGDVK